MFNIHSTEILLILIVALIVIGPEKLPTAIKTAGLWVGRFRRSFYKVKAEIERELNTDEIRRQLHNESVMAQIEDAKAKVTTVAKETETSVNSLVNTDSFDPGASEATNQKSAPEKSSSSAINTSSEDAAEATREVYNPTKNPKVAQAEDTSKVIKNDGVS
jgi:sec-independent protein translocase protein TatB